MAWGIEGHSFWCTEVIQAGTHLYLSQFAAAGVCCVDLLLHPPWWLLDFPLPRQNGQDPHLTSLVSQTARVLFYCFHSSPQITGHHALRQGVMWMVFLASPREVVPWTLETLLSFLWFIIVLSIPLMQYFCHALVFSLCWLSSSLVEISSFCYTL